MKSKPTDYYNIPGYNIEYTNRIGQEKGGVCLFISDKVKYTLRSDICIANNSFESCLWKAKKEIDKMCSWSLSPAPTEFHLYNADCLRWFEIGFTFFRLSNEKMELKKKTLI